MPTPPDLDNGFLDDALRRYVEVPSVNPAFSDTATGEDALATAVAADLAESGFEVQRIAAGAGVAGRDSVVGRLRGTGGGRSLMLYGHLDTVGPGDMVDPFRARLHEGRLYGRGTYDMKSGLASCVAAARHIATGPRPAGDLLVVAVADEEDASLGIQSVLEHVRADAAIVTEPTELEICVAHKGFLWIEVETRGRAAHGSRFHEGVDANLRMGRVLAEIDALEGEVRTGPTHPLLGPGSLHIGTLRGGSGLSVYADRCVAGVERRTLPGESGSALIEELRRRLAAGVERWGPVEVRLLLERHAFEANADSAVVSALTDAARDVLGIEPALQGNSFWMDAAFTSRAGIDTVVFGPTGAGAHADEEWVDLESVHRHCSVLVACARSWCGVR